MNAPTALQEAVTGLAGRFAGRLIEPADPAYDEVRRVHNGLVDKRPALIARCRGVADIVDALNLAREQSLEVAVRGGGHSVAGLASVDRGLMIDLSLMKGIHVDPKRRTARAEAGVTWSEFNRETQFHGLATTGGVVSTTGIAGYTLGGGLGWLMGEHGLAIDNLLSADVVTADGRVRTASRREAPDLFWALRGGGGNFGIVSSFEFRLHPVGPEITGGLVAHPFSRASDVVKFYREMTETVPDALTAYAAFSHLPGGEKMAAIAVCDCRRPGRGAGATKRLKAFGTPILDAVGPMGYCQLNSMMDANYPRGASSYWKSSFLTELSDEAIRVMTDCYARCPSPMTDMLLEHFHGAATRVRESDTAFPNRRECHNLLVLAQWTDPADSERCIGWARETYAAMKPFAAPGRYVNYMSDNKVGDPVAAAYGRNYPRLQKLKRKYDPANVFHLNQNVQPAGRAGGR